MIVRCLEPFPPNGSLVRQSARHGEKHLVEMSKKVLTSAVRGWSEPLRQAVLCLFYTGRLQAAP